MKRKFWAVPLTVIALACTVLLGACGGSSVEEFIREDLDEAFGEISPEDEEFIDSMNESSGSSFELLDIDITEFAEAYLDGFSYEIGEVTVDEERGVATGVVKVKMKTLTQIMTDFSEQYQAWISNLDPNALPTEEELYAKGGEILMEVTKNAKPQESDVIIDYSKNEEGVWAPDEGAEMALFDAMM